MDGLSPSEARLVRKLATILRVADSLDRSHLQPVSRTWGSASRGSRLSFLDASKTSPSS